MDLHHAVRRLWPDDATEQVAAMHALNRVPDPPGPRIVAQALEDIHWCARQPNATAHATAEVALPADRQVRRCTARILHATPTENE